MNRGHGLVRHRKAQTSARRFAADIEVGRAIARSGSQGIFADPTLRVLQAFRVVANLGCKTKRPQRHGARHRLLHVGVAGQFDGPVAGCEGVERVRDRDGAGMQRLCRVAQVQSQCRKHLVVARAASVQTSAGCADARGQQVLYRGLAVLLFEGDAPCAGGVLRTDGGQGVADRDEIRSRQQSSLAEHFRMRNRGQNIVFDQSIIQRVIVAGRVGEHSCIERRSLVPKSSHRVIAG